MKRRLVLASSFILSVAALLFGRVPAAVPNQDTVVLLHGIGQSRLHMKGIEHALSSAGYTVVNISYPSLKKDISTLTIFLHDYLKESHIWRTEGRVHFVTNSMGGLVTRYYLDTYKNEIPADKLGRIVMLAPPNRGSEVADLLEGFAPYRYMFGPAGQELTTSAQGKITHTPYYDLGIIAGSKGHHYPFANFIIPGGSKAHDGRVAVSSTLIPGVTDHLVVHATHSFMAWRSDVHKHILTFIQTGKFDHAA